MNYFLTVKEYWDRALYVTSGQNLTIVQILIMGHASFQANRRGQTCVKIENRSSPHLIILTGMLRQV